ncbi:MFS transporter [Pseudomonas sp. MTM4]|uniref:MFS transporter n=1 Tax=unclassified Pseudomonas TaxID=196821 RepID=UPI0018D26022|nr:MULTISPECIES: MFS transporter [unclassified Pseudomonas]MBC8649263.1 MFS transporter [Pseudomonas sp. MT4]QXY90618.1 MFS transporter [Pseudomonas sp. MTM4]
MPVRIASLTPILVACCLGFLVVQLDVSVVHVGLGALKEAFGTDLTGLQWVINSYALAFSALLILGGTCGDKWGAKSAFTAGFATFTLGSIGCGLADSMTTLITMRVLQGLGAAFMVPTSLTLIRLSFENPDQRKSAVALWGACGGIALAAGPVMGGLLIDYLGWRSVFLINVPIGVLAICLISRYAPASPRISKKIDAGGQASIAISVAALTYALTESSGQGWTALTLSSLAIATFFLLVFLLVERQVQAPMLPARLAKNTMLVSMSLAGAVINLTFYGTVFVFSIYFQTILEYDAFETGLSFIPLTAVLTLSTLISARVARTISARRIITTGFIIQVVGFLALSQIDSESPLWVLNGALMLVGIGSACSVPSITNSMLAAVSKHDAGIASGLMASARQLGGVIGVAVFGTMIAKSDTAAFAQGMSNAMLVSALALALCLGVVLLLTRRPVAAPDAEQSVSQNL